jgi:hypothetical protein
MEPEMFEWNFAGIANDNPDAAKICLWEYGRECEPLIEQIDFLRNIASDHRPSATAGEIALLLYSVTGHRRYVPVAAEMHAVPMGADFASFADDAIPAVEEIEKIAWRFNWGLFCSEHFPDKPWLEPVNDCPIRRHHQIWHESALPNPHVEHAELTLEIEQGAIANIGDVEHTLLDMAGVTDSTGDLHAHLFLIDDAVLDRHSPAAIAKQVKHQLDLRNRQRLNRGDAPFLNLTRDDKRTSLHRLAIARLTRGLSQQQALDTIGNNLARLNISDEVYRWLKVEDATRFSDYRRDAIAIYRKLFHVGEDVPRCCQAS